MIEDVGDRGFVGGVQEIRRRLACLRHAHVERPVALEGKAALGLVELHRRHADVEHDTVDRRRQRLVQPGELAVDQSQPRLGLDQRLAIGDGIGIAVEGDDLRPPAQHRTGIAACPERAVDMRLAGRDGERIEHFVEQDGDVRGVVDGGAHSAIPFSWQWKRAAEIILAGRPGVSTNVLGSQISI